MPLNAKQQQFVAEYIVDLNATQAAIRAGYSARSAGKIASQLLEKTRIRAAVDEALAARQERTSVTADWVVWNLAKNVKRAMQAEPVLDKEGNPTGEYRYDGAVANKALELLGKHLSMFTDKQEVTGAGGKDLIVKIIGGASVDDL